MDYCPFNLMLTLQSEAKVLQCFYAHCIHELDTLSLFLSKCFCYFISIDTVELLRYTKDSNAPNVLNLIFL